MSEQKQKQLLPMAPYFLRMYFQYIVDNGYTPHLVVYTALPDVKVPASFIKDDHITLNISPASVKYLDIADEFITFEGRFNGVVHQCFIPVNAVLAIVARENPNIAMTFQVLVPADPAAQNVAPVLEKKEERPKPTLRVVK